ncbi:MAG: hypothetical protein K0B10_07260 [Vicingaceae bacterium]|nr:hypothetical protein [Vicingaceae bacterium]
MRNKTLINERNKQLEEDFNALSKNFPKKPDVVYTLLRKKYFITNRTIDAILSGEYDKPKKVFINPNQLTIL